MIYNIQSLENVDSEISVLVYVNSSPKFAIFFIIIYNIDMKEKFVH